MGQVTENPTYELDLNTEGDSVEVNVDDESGKAEIVEAAPETDKPALAEPVDKQPEPAAAADDNSGELKEYSESVKKRIDKLTSRLREAERREQAALEFAKGVQTQFTEVQKRAQQSDYGRLAEAKSRVDTQLLTIRQIIKKAREEGDIDTETEAQERLAALVHDQRQVEVAEAQRAVQNQQQQFQQQQVFQQPVYQQPQQAARVDPKAESWAEKNPWFGKDTVLTHAAWGIHRQLISMEGFDPQSDEYYDELDRRMHDAFPQRFKQSGQQEPNRATRNVQTVAPASRSSGINASARRKVHLSPSQVAIAKKLGVPLEEYAKYVKD